LSLSPSALFWRVREAEPERLLHRARRAAFIFRARALAAWHRASIELDIDPSIRFGPDVRITVTPRTDNVLRIGPGARVDDRVLFRFLGGRVELGPDVHLRAGVVLNVAGHLVLEGGNILSWSTVVHCAESVHLERWVGAAEHVTIVDSTHFFTTPHVFFYENTRTAPIRIGENSWLCPKATVTSGVCIGAHCIVGSSSVVIRDVPDGHLASGVPAKNRPLDLPWETGSVTHG
jgi:acetyltransferase-like isoleucine patch superfamily enzyme